LNLGLGVACRETTFTAKMEIRARGASKKNLGPPIYFCNCWS